MDGGAWKATVHGVAESDNLSDLTERQKKITFSYFSSKLHESPLIGDKRCEDLLHIL